MKRILHALALVAATGTFATPPRAAPETDVGKLTCADFLAMSSDEKRAVLKTLIVRQTESREQTDARPDAPEDIDAGSTEADAQTEAPDANEAVVDTELEAVEVACAGYEAAFVADRMTP